VLLLHGFPTCAYDWRGVIDRLEDAFRCIAPDFPGYGLSDKPAAYSYSLFQQTDAIEGLLRALGITEAHVVSHDVGTSVHTELLAREQEGRLPFRVLSSVFLNGSMLQGMATITAFQKLLSANETLPQAMAFCEKIDGTYIPGLKSVMKKPGCLTPDDETVLSETMAYQDGNRRLPALAVYMRERYLHIHRWIGALRSAKAPVQLIWADGDPVANIQLGRALQGELPAAGYTELPGLGHFLLMEDPEAVGSAIRGSLASV
jgi:pimeloyl-ACP methyl ester carboxylesterase